MSCYTMAGFEYDDVSDVRGQGLQENVLDSKRDSNLGKEGVDRRWSGIDVTRFLEHSLWGLVNERKREKKVRGSNERRKRDEELERRKNEVSYYF